MGRVLELIDLLLPNLNVTSKFFVDIDVVLRYIFSSNFNVTSKFVCSAYKNEVICRVKMQRWFDAYWEIGKRSRYDYAHSALLRRDGSDMSRVSK